VTNKDLLEKYIDALVEVRTGLNKIDERLDCLEDQKDLVEIRTSLTTMNDHLKRLDDRKSSRNAIFTWLGGRAAPAVQLLFMVLAIGLIQLFGFQWAISKYVPLVSVAPTVEVSHAEK